MKSLEKKTPQTHKQGYELQFAGKKLAKALADRQSKKYLKAESQQSKNFHTTQNVIIRGDNLDALKILQKNYLGKIKTIYIDPPYNTKSEEFIYKDNFKLNQQDLLETFEFNEDHLEFLNNMYGTQTHSGWLAFMYPRLRLARNLLTDDGVIFHFY